MRRNGLREGMIVWAKGDESRLAVLGMCCEEKCGGRKLCFIGRPYRECVSDLRILPTGYSLGRHQAATLLPGLASCEDISFSKPRFWIPREINLGNFPAGRIVVRENEKYPHPFFAVLLIDGNFSLKLWEIGAMTMEEISLSSRLFDTRLELPPDQLSRLVEQLNH